MFMGRIAMEAFARIQGFGRAWRCPDRILVIESDDWGSIRTSTLEAYKFLASHGYDMKRSRWSVDALETDGDLVALFDVLNHFRDRRGYPACVTANMVMANPDFDAIREDGFHKYTYEPVETSLEKSPRRNGVTRLWREGMAKRLFRPQFHAREHVRWWEWMDALRKGSPEAVQTFDLNMCGVPLAVSKVWQSFFQPIYMDPPSIGNAEVDIACMISEGIELFHKQFGFRSLSTVAPNIAWTDEIEYIWVENGIRYIQGGFVQHAAYARGEKRIAHYLGEKSRWGGIYLVRNCTFEPARSAADDYWKESLRQIARAFYFKTPAIVSSHRVNFMGSIVESNRDRGLVQLKQLLNAICARWPDVHFLSSAELGYMIEHGLRSVSELEGKETDVFPVVTHEKNIDAYGEI